MARFEDGCYGSLKGIALIAKALAGRCQILYTRVAVGKGTIPDNLTPKALTEPPEYVMDAMISSITNPVDGECEVSVQISSAYVETGFYAKWLILYAEDPDEGEVPFTALCLENEPEWIRPASSIVGKLATFDIIAAVGDVDTVTATIDPDSLVTHKEWERLAAQIAARRLDITIPASGWTQGGTAKRPYIRDIPEESATERMVPSLTILPEGEDAAFACGLAPFAQTLDGVLRVYAKSAPTVPIRASLVLQGDSSGFLLSGNGGGGINALPPATADTLGGVKVGSGLNVGPDGTLSVDAERVMTDEDLVNEDEIANSVASILNGDGAK